MPANFCKDCRHSKLPENGDEYRMTCESPNNSVAHTPTERYLVTGIEQPVVMAQRGASCVALRQDRGAQVNMIVCGPSAQWFEGKI